MVLTARPATWSRSIKHCDMKKWCMAAVCLCFSLPAFSWGFFAHKLINYHAVFLLPPDMMVLYKPHIHFLREHAVDPDKRRYVAEAEGARHYIDMDRYGVFPYDTLPREWGAAVDRFTEDSLQAHGIVPWWIETLFRRLTRAFEEKNQAGILRLSAEIGHYIADAHVPLHACSNYNGQFTGQQGIHAFWESRVPELLAQKEWDLFTGGATYISATSVFAWNRVLESAAAADTVLREEQQLSLGFPPGRKYAFEHRNGIIVKQYSTDYTTAFDRRLNRMVERRMRQAIHSVASFWFSAWVNAGQPDLRNLASTTFSEAEKTAFEELNKHWLNGAVKGKSCN